MHEQCTRNSSIVSEKRRRNKAQWLGNPRMLVTLTRVRFETSGGGGGPSDASLLSGWPTSMLREVSQKAIGAVVGGRHHEDVAPMRWRNPGRGNALEWLRRGCASWLRRHAS